MSFRRPKDAQYYYKHTYYKLGKGMYAQYFSKVWRESASVTNDELKENGVILVTHSPT